MDRRILHSVALFFIAVTLLRAEDPLQKQSESFFPLPLHGRLEIENIDGAIHLYGWYEPRVRLLAVRKAYTKARLEQIGIKTAPSPNSLIVQTILPAASGLFADRSGTVEYGLNVPEPAEIKIKMHAGEISLQGLRGAQVEIDLVNGRIAAINSYAGIGARSQNGVMEAFFDWWENLPASYDFLLGHGRIGLRLPPVAKFRVGAQTDDGRIHQEFGLSSPQDLGAGQRLKGETSPPGQVSFGLKTGGGNITIEQAR